MPGCVARFWQFFQYQGNTLAALGYPEGESLHKNPASAAPTSLSFFAASESELSPSA